MQFIRNVFSSFFSLDNYGDTEHDYHFPTTMEGFGYQFNENGQLTQTSTDEPFQYKVKENDRQYNQAHYEALGVCIGHHIEEVLMTEYNLQRLQIPLKEPNDPEDKARSHVYISEDALTSPDTLLVLLQGSGTIRPGQWSRRVIMNESLEAGSMFPYIERAQHNGWNVMILNPNNNEIAYEDGDGQDFGGEGGLSFSKNPGSMTIDGCETPEHHCQYVWDNLIKDCKAEHIVIVAFSYGGHAISVLATQNALEFTQRVNALALIDSVHSHTEHENAPGAAKDSIMQYLENEINQ
ncbi:hypothetical protein INT43_006276 [Umbelopsis isabellina]|uniref:Arb2 domain-containing protein n=1 Tax=Mortierella isabellina TaxID=91625 RepID=A0A8H7PZR0_MORIS|nr:hypothetical protein INT43_006276 [Umbelopsis isabellina]